MAVLKDVPWKDLADQLDLGQNTAIETTCRNDPASCYLKEVVKRFMSTQHAEPCRRTVEKIVTALEGLSPPHVKVASELRKKFNLGKHFYHITQLLLYIYWEICACQ